MRLCHQGSGTLAHFRVNRRWHSETAMKRERSLGVVPHSIRCFYESPNVRMRRSIGTPGSNRSKRCLTRSLAAHARRNAHCHRQPTTSSPSSDDYRVRKLRLQIFCRAAPRLQHCANFTQGPQLAPVQVNALATCSRTLSHIADGVEGVKPSPPGIPLVPWFLRIQSHLQPQPTLQRKTKKPPAMRGFKVGS